MKIAFFDSGVGGLNVLYDALKLLPNEQYIYYADSINAPYGTKSNEEIKKLVFEAVDFLAHENIKALVVACNTATSVTVKALREKYSFPIIGMEPAIKPALKNNNNKKTLVCATEKTLKEEKLKALIQNLNGENKVVELSLQELVVYAENFEFNEPHILQYLKKCFVNIKWKEFDSLVLGCTHFYYFTKQLRGILPRHIRILDGNFGTVKHLKNSIIETDTNQKTKIEFFISGEKAASSHFEKYFDFIKKNQ
ncbi:MAG: glutamate racemase [Saprospiraceae bacterium]|nr:glutamate racemase [Saprospiraceae bacterium]